MFINAGNMGLRTETETEANNNLVVMSVFAGDAPIKHRLKVESFTMTHS